MKSLALSLLTLVIVSNAQAAQVDISGEYTLVSSVCSKSVFAAYESSSVTPKDGVSVSIKKTGQDSAKYEVTYDVAIKNSKKATQDKGWMRTWELGSESVLSAKFSLSPVSFTITSAGGLLTIVEQVVNEGDACSKGETSISVYKKKKVLGLF